MKSYPFLDQTDVQVQVADAPKKKMVGGFGLIGDQNYLQYL